MSEHTPTPWFLKARESALTIWSADKIQVFHTSWHQSIREVYPLKKEAIANVEFTIQAVNSHTALVEALKECLREYGGTHIAGECERKARAALALAGATP